MKSINYSFTTILAVILTISSGLNAQNKGGKQSEGIVGNDTLRKDALNVYMQASNHIRREITFINYVRDIKEAQLVILRSQQQTGAGGSRTTFLLEGQLDMDGKNDTIIYNASPDDTREQRREGEIRTLKMGLMRYILETPLAEFIDIQFTEPIADVVSTDKWNNWVFSANLGGSTRGESQFE